MIIIEGIRDLHYRTVNKAIKQHVSLKLPINVVCFANGRQVSFIHLNAALAEREF